MKDGLYTDHGLAELIFASQVAAYPVDSLDSSSARTDSCGGTDDHACFSQPFDQVTAKETGGAGHQHASR